MYYLFSNINSGSLEAAPNIEIREYSPGRGFNFFRNSVLQHENCIFMTFFFFKYLAVPIIIIFPRMGQKLLLDERAMVLVGGCATPNFAATTEIRGSQGNCCDYSFLLGPRQELSKHNILLIF